MIFEKLRKNLDSDWIKKNAVWDIVLYGSYARGKFDARDIDIAIILEKKTSVRKKLLLSQQLRKSLSEKGYVLDVKTVDFKDFLNVGFLGREGIIAEGRSLLKNDYLAERFGFSAQALMRYRLKTLSPAKQKMFYYSLQGRKKGTGILAKINGKIISKGIIQIPIKNYEELKAIFEHHQVKFITTFALQYRIIR